MKKLSLIIILLGLSCNIAKADSDIVNVLGIYPSVEQWAKAKEMFKRPMITVDYAVLTNNEKIMSSIWYLKDNGYEESLNTMVKYNHFIIFSELPYDKDVDIKYLQNGRMGYVINSKYKQLKSKELAQIILNNILDKQ